MKRFGSVEILGLLLVFALYAAWITWQSDEPLKDAPEEVSLWSIEPSTVGQVLFTTPASSVKLEARLKTDKNYTVWATSKRERSAIPSKKDSKVKDAKYQ